MTESIDEKKVFHLAKKALDSYTESLEAETLTKIGSVRRQALNGVNRSMPWYASWRALAGGGIAAAALALILTVRMDPLSELDPIRITEDIELLASGEELDFIDQLEFYQWLEEEKSAAENAS